MITVGVMTWVYVLYESKNVMEENIKKNAEKINLMMVNRIDSYVTDRIVDVVNLADDETIKSAAAGSTAQFSKMQDPEQYIDKNDLNWTSSPKNKTTPFMDALISNPTSDRLREVQGSEKALFHDNVYDEIFITNAYGANVAQTDRTTDYRQNDESWWQEASKNGIYVGHIKMDNSTGTISFSIAKRIEDKSGNFLGVLKAVTNVRQVINIIKTQMESGQYAPSEYELITTNGLVLYSTNAGEKPLSYGDDKEFMSNIKGNSGTFTYTPPNSDVPYITTYAKSSSSKITPLFDWIFVTEYKPTDILKPVIQLTNIMIIAMITLVSAVSIMAFIISNKLSGPIEKIRLGLDEYLDGKNPEIKLEGTDELKILASDVNHMMRKMTENNHAIITSKEKYKTLYQLTPTPIVLVNENLKITDSNNAFSELFGYTKEEVIGKPASFLISGESLDKYNEFVEKYDKNTNFHDEPFVHKKKDGTTFPSLVNVRSIYDTEKKFVTNLVTIKDIKEIEEAKKKLEEREEKILNQYLHLTQTNELREQFTAMISHELTTPLFPIKFYAEMLKDPAVLGRLNKEQIKAIDEIYQNATRLERLIGDILDAQKLDLKTMRFSKTKFELDEFMADVVHDNSMSTVSKSIEFVNSTKDKTPVVSDPDRLKQVFSNLIANSVDFTPEKTGKIEICAKVQEKDILFYVKDNGVGIPKEKQTQLFSKFYQIDTSLKRKHRGSGLGLSICKGIVEALGGKIWLESTVGLGTVVYFTIPRTDTI
ncbi:MAG: PAS domain S-box protein [Thaumarchaeota archaeon]|nr:PAS domain S-box protein [Nitrososphaerota archaeon]